ncbi:NERD domain-containing protein kinase family protein [Neobacillus sp. SCS-31]|uniref:NERD domain-containing protein kinase family protein n=1 Tax=Neobacillus oceani TaxID=3115292 RepID=UPI003905ECF4
MESKVVFAGVPKENEKRAIQELKKKLPRENHIIIVGALVPKDGYIKDQEMDVIMICPKGIFNIEMKSYRGTIVTPISNMSTKLVTRTITGEQKTIDNPIIQAASQSRTLHSYVNRKAQRRLGKRVSVRPVILFTSPRNELAYEIDQGGTNEVIHHMDTISKVWMEGQVELTPNEITIVYESFGIREVKFTGQSINIDVGGYVTKRLLFEQSNYHVYEAVDEFDQKYFLKVHEINPALLKEDQELFLTITKRDTKVRAKLKDNPYVLYYHASPFTYGDYICSTTQWVGHTSFFSLIKKARPLDEKMALLKELFKALRSIHSQGVFHRDLTPRNILYTDDQKLKIINFDYSRILGEPTVGAGIPFDEKNAYAAPETNVEERKADIDFHTDYYSFGIIAYEFLAGKYPYKSDIDLKHDTLDKIVPGVSDEFAFGVESLISISQKDRDFGWEYLEELWGL